MFVAVSCAGIDKVSRHLDVIPAQAGIHGEAQQHI
jgi:hypothetical protein